VRVVRPPSSTPASFIAATIWNSSPSCPTVRARLAKEKRAFEDRHENTKAYIDYSSDALQEIESFFKRSHKVIVVLTVQEILDEHIAEKLV
jgi:hypothetical protein